jgi:hypothetical protein
VSFPSNILAALEAPLLALDGVEAVEMRLPRMTDENGTVCLIAAEWTPGEVEIAGDHMFFEPTTATYDIAISHQVLHDDPEAGLALHAEVATRIRRMLYRDPAVRLSLLSLNEVDGDHRERVLKYAVPSQRYANNKFDDGFRFLSATQLIVTTETV